MNQRGRQGFWTDKRKADVARAIREGMASEFIAQRHGLSVTALRQAIWRFGLSDKRRSA
jgi:hypothetical protein